MAIGLAIVLGIVAGFVGYLPYLLANRRVRGFRSSQRLKFLGWFLFAVLASFAILAAGAYFCMLYVSGSALPFLFTEIVVLLVLISLACIRERKGGNDK